MMVYKVVAANVDANFRAENKLKVTCGQGCPDQSNTKEKKDSMLEKSL